MLTRYNIIMSLPFSRSQRSLSSDRYLVSRIGLVLAGLVVIALLTWFFFAHVGLYESSTDLEYTSEGYLDARFPTETAVRLKPGQEGSLKFVADEESEAIEVPVYVFRIDRKEGVVTLLVGGLPASQSLSDGKIDGLVEVEVARITPFDLVIRSGIGSNPNRQVPVNNGQTQD